MNRKSQIANRKSQIIVLFILTMMVLWSGELYACLGTLSNWYQDTNAITNRTIYVYVEQDFGSELSAGTVTADDDSLSESNVQRAIIAQMEKWNNSARGLNLVFAGTWPFENPSTLCGFVSHPAVYVHYKQVTGTAVATVSYVRDQFDFDNDGNTNEVCPKFLQIQMKKGALLGSQGSSFEKTMLHEFGHVLELGHAHTDTYPSCHSVMAYTGSGVPSEPCSQSSDCSSSALRCDTWQGLCVAVCPSTQSGNYGHPRGWDISCIKQYQNGMDAEYRYVGFSSLGVVQPPISTNIRTDQGFIGGNYLINNFSSQRLPLWIQNGVSNNGSVQWSSIGYDGYFSFSPTTGSTDNLPGRPMLSRFPELPTTQVSYMVAEYYYGDFYGAKLGVYVANDEFNNEAFDYIQQCVNSTCSSLKSIRSPFSATTAFDPISNSTVIGYVEIPADHTASLILPKIWVSPGLTSNYPKIHRAEKFKQNFANINLPSVAGNWKFRGETHFPLAIACADAAAGLTYNCMMAWTDNGVFNGAILYTYFRRVGDSIEYLEDATGKNIAYWRGTADSSNSPSLGFFANKFYLAWKTPDSPSRIAYTTKSGSSYASGWSTTIHYTEPRMADSPSFVGQNGNEAAMVWTVTN